MYTPKSFSIEEEDFCLSFIEEHGFGLILNHSHETYMTLTPMLYKEDYLVGHIARANPQSSSWRRDQTPVTILFTGPHCYISPTYYHKTTSVPTWNYTAVRVDGTLSVVEDRTEQVDIINSIVGKYEKNREQPWVLDTSYERHMGLFEAIVCFKVKISSMNGTFKLNQNKSHEDQRSVIESLKANNGKNELEVAQLMNLNLSEV